jgi:hypothetical protein
MEALSMVAPVGYALDWLLYFSDTSKVLTTGVVSVFGVLAGSAAVSLATRSFRWEGFANVEDMATHLVGAALMGVGGVTAVGCTVGQGLSGISTLALGSVLALAAITACASAPPANPRLDDARAQLRAARADPMTQGLAGPELRNADAAIDAAETALARGDDSVSVDHLAYLASQRTVLLEQAALRRAAEATVAQATAQRDQQRLVARTQEADSATRSAQASQRDAQASQRDAQLAQRQAETAQRDGCGVFRGGHASRARRL